MKLRLHRFVQMTQAEGPGIRACLWVQGCPIRCPGCMQPQTWPETGGESVEVSDLASRILSGPEIEGVTFLGGEPFAQASALAELALILQGHGLSIITFTGYTLEELQSAGREDWERLIAVTDLLIDGPYRENLQDFSRPWTGSSNQRYHFLTDRYRNLEDKLHTIENRLEIEVAPTGEILINGMGPTDTLKALKKSMECPSARKSPNP